MAEVELLGRVAASFRHEAILLDDEERERLAIPRWLVGYGDLVMVRVFGTSMIDAAIAPGDLAVIRKQQEAGDYASTLEPLRNLIAERPNDPETNYLYGTALLYGSEPSLAIFPLRQSMDDPAWLVPAGIQLAQAALITADFNEAVNATTRILERNGLSCFAISTHLVGQCVCDPIDARHEVQGRPE